MWPTRTIWVGKAMEWWQKDSNIFAPKTIWSLKDNVQQIMACYGKVA